MSERLRIAYVYRHFNRSGSLPSVFASRAERLAGDEDVTAVCSSTSREATSAPVTFATVEPLVVGRARVTYAAECASFAFRATRWLARERERFDVIHVVGIAAATADLVTVPAVRPAEVEDYFRYVEPDARLRRLVHGVARPQSVVTTTVERLLFRAPFPFCIAETAAVSRELQHHYGVPVDAIDVITPGVDTGRFRYDADARAALRGELAAPDERLVVLFVGDDFERKGLERAIAGIARTGADAELWVAGGGPSERYRRAAAEHGVTERVRFLGRVPHWDVHRLYSAADVFVLPSQFDVWGYPVVEALAAGRAVAVSERAGAHELIHDGVNGFVLEGAGSPEELAGVLDRVADPAARAAIAERAVETAAGFDDALVYARLRQAHHKAHERRLRLAATRPPAHGPRPGAQRA